jgi:hypothetical protein
VNSLSSRETIRPPTLSNPSGCRNGQDRRARQRGLEGLRSTTSDGDLLTKAAGCGSRN